MKISALAIFLLGTAARAEDVEQLEVGTVITQPGHPVETTTDARWLLSRPAVEKAIVTAADLRACRESVKACEQRAAGADPKAGFFESTSGKVVLGVAGAVLFSSGLLLGAHVR